MLLQILHSSHNALPNHNKWCYYNSTRAPRLISLFALVPFSWVQAGTGQEGSLADTVQFTYMSLVIIPTKPHAP